MLKLMGEEIFTVLRSKVLFISKPLACMENMIVFMTMHAVAYYVISNYLK